MKRRFYRCIPSLASSAARGLRWTMIALLVCQVPAAFAPMPLEDEYAVKAAFIYNFVRFTEWPAQAFHDHPNAPIFLYILGDDPFGVHIDSLEQRTVQGRRIEVRRLTDIQGIQDCHVLFISVSEEPQLAEILTLVEGRSILTISEIDDFALRGGSIGVFERDDKIRFQINTRATRQAGLEISSKLLRLASIVPKGRAD